MAMKGSALAAAQKKEGGEGIKSLVQSGGSDAGPGSNLPVPIGKPQNRIGENVKHMFAIPITRRPLIPGAYMSLQVKHPANVAEIKKLVDQSDLDMNYIGIFLR